MAVSENGWTVNPPRTRRLVPGTNDVRLTVADGPAGDVLMYVAEQFDRRVEDLDLDSSRGELDDWGHADRPIRGGVTASNHASATAVDFNATRHALSARGTFSRAQVAEIREILAEVDNVVRWGGDYTNRADEMHFEINADYAQVARVADRLKDGGFLMGLTQAQQNQIFNAANRVLGFCQQRYYAIRNGKAVQVQPTDPGARPCGALDNLDGAYLVQQILDNRAELAKVRAELAAVRGEQVSDADLDRELEEMRAKMLTDWEEVSRREEVEAAE
jgi:hypothetical protein